MSLWGAFVAGFDLGLVLILLLAVAALEGLAMLAYRLGKTASASAITFTQLLALSIAYFGGVLGVAPERRFLIGGVFLALLPAALLMAYILEGIRGARSVLANLLTALVGFTLTWMLGLTIASAFGLRPLEPVPANAIWLLGISAVLAESAGLIVVIPIYAFLSRRPRLPRWAAVAATLTISPSVAAAVLLAGSLFNSQSAPYYGLLGASLGARILTGLYITPGLVIFLRRHAAATPQVGTLDALAQSTATRRSLEEAEARYRALFIAAPDIIVLCDRDGIIRDCNRQAEKQLGYSREQLVGAPVWRFWAHGLAERDAERRIRNWLNGLKTDEPSQFEGVVRRADGTTFPVGVNLTRVGGPESGFLAVAHDLTRQHRDRARLEGQIAELNTLAEVAHIASSAQDLPALLKISADRVADLTGADVCYVTLWDDERQEMRLAASSGITHDATRQSAPVREAERPTLTWKVLDSGHPMVVHDFTRSPYYKPDLVVGEPIQSAAAFPLIAEGRRLGALTIGYFQHHAFSPDEMNAVERMANLVALSIGRLRLLEQTRERLDHALVLNRLAERAALTLNAREILQILAEEAIAALGVRQGVALEYDAERGTMALAAGRPSPESGDILGVRFLAAPFPGLRDPGWDRRPMVFPNVQDDDRFAAMHELTRRAGMETLILAPMEAHGRLYGLLALDGTGREALITAETDLLASIAHYGALALETANLYAETVQRQRLAETLREVGLALGSTLDYDEIMDRILDGLTRVVQCDAANIQLIQGDAVRIIRGRGYEQFGIAADMEGLTLPLAEARLLQQMTQTRRPVIVRDVLTEPRWFAPEAWRGRPPFCRSWMGAPIVMRGEVIGFINADSIEPNAYSERDAETLALFAAQAGVAMQNARLYAEAHEQRAIAEALRQAAVALSSSLNAEEILDQILVLLERVISYDAANIQAIQDGRVVLARLRGYERIGPDAERAAREAFFNVHDVPNIRAMIETRRPHVIPDTWSDPQWIKAPGLEWIRSWAAAPIIVEDEVVGFINVDGTEPGKYGPHHADVLDAFARQAAGALRNARLYEQAQRRLRELTAIYQTGQRLQQLQPPVALAQEAIRALSDVIGYEHGGVMLLDERTGALETVALIEKGMDAPSLAAEMERVRAFDIRLGRGITGWVAEHGESLRVDDVRQDPRYIGVREEMMSELCVPMKVGDRVLGVINVESVQLGAYSESDQRLLETVAAQLAVAIQNARLYEDLQRAYEQLRLSQDEAMRAERLRALGQMASGIAHDFNNVLTPVLGYLELALEHPNMPDEARSDVERARRGALAASSIVARLREFYRPRDATEPFVPVDLNRVIGEAVDLTRPRWRDIPQEQGVVIDMRLELGPSPRVQGDPAALRDLLTNLIANAVDAMPDGGTITIRTQTDGGSVLLSVSDTGVGMTEEVRRRAFEPFFSTKGSQGTGLGLSICYGIVQRHGGSIDLQSERGKGTTVFVRLPISGDTLPIGGDETLPALPPLTILLVDDEESVRAVVERMLTRAGHKVVTAGGGPEGIAEIQKRKPGEIDVVITDLGMPQVTGREVARASKSHMPQTPVILLTGWGGKMGQELAAPEDVDDILTKPVQSTDLHRTLARVLGLLKGDSQ
ncbi:MAG: GAF domain-containing protein [Anaerolineae bacterium]|nr:GAF domain-containing protein [Anaerolineae bacterium]